MTTEKLGSKEKKIAVSLDSRLPVTNIRGFVESDILKGLSEIADKLEGTKGGVGQFWDDDIAKAFGLDFSLRPELNRQDSGDEWFKTIEDKLDLLEAGGALAWFRDPRTFVDVGGNSKPDIKYRSRRYTLKMLPLSREVIGSIGDVNRSSGIARVCRLRD